MSNTSSTERRWCNEHFWHCRISMSRPCFHRTSSIRWGEAPWVYGHPQVKKTVFLRFLKHLSVIRCYPIPILFRYRKDGKIIWREANPKASRCLDPGTKLKKPRGIIILRARFFLNGGGFFYFLGAARHMFFCPQIPRTAPIFCLPTRNFVRTGAPFCWSKKGEAFRPLLICKLFIKFYNTIRLWYYRPNFLSTYFFKVSANVLHAFSPSE